MTYTFLIISPFVALVKLLIKMFNRWGQKASFAAGLPRWTCAFN